MLQIDALAYVELRRAIELGYCPTIEKMVREEGYTLRRWFCGLPSATPYCQAGIFHGENEGIPAFRFYDKTERRVITCNTPSGVQYIRDRIHAPGALAGGSSYVNLLDGDAQTVAFTVATRERMSAFQRLGGWRMAALILLHPIRVMRMGLSAVIEWFREEYERAVGEFGRKRTHSEGLFPFIRVLSNVIVRELQTMAILLDIYLGVPIIYSTFMQYDELGHHFGPSSFQALRDLRRTDARIREIRRMIANRAGREYDLVLLSDHGMTPSSSYRVKFGETLGRTVERILDVDAATRGVAPLRSSESYADTSEYADMGAQVVEAVVQVTPESQKAARRALHRVRDWVRSKYGVRELIFPEKFRVEADHEVVVTYSSCLALLYFADEAEPLDLEDIIGDERRAMLYSQLLTHAGVGLLGTRRGQSVHLESSSGQAIITAGRVEVLAGVNPLEPYGTGLAVVRAVEHLVSQHNAGDITIFGAYDGYEIVSFDDQIGAHGAAGEESASPVFDRTAASTSRARADRRRARRPHGGSPQVCRAVARSSVIGRRSRWSSHSYFLIVLSLQQRRDTTSVIAGRVVDSVSAEPRAGATVSIVGTLLGAFVDGTGHYVITGVPSRTGSAIVRARLLGYRTIETTVGVRPGETTYVDFRLRTEATVLNAVRTEARPVDRDVFDSRPSVGTVQVTARAAEGVPKLGEPDVMRIVQLLPGVEARNDFSTGLNVRGGEADQNLILIDGYPIYNPFHLGGLFSTFIDPTVRDLTLMTGGFPARYGSRLSSVLDVRSAEEVRPGIHGTAEVSVLASTGELASTFAGGKGTWMIAGRRTYADKFVELISSNELPYHFRDEQAHLSYFFTPHTKLSITAYDGRDQLDADIASFSDSTNANASGGTFNFGWGNTVAGASLLHSFARAHRPGLARFFLGDSTTLEQRASISVFKTSLDLGEGSLTLKNRVSDESVSGSLAAHTVSHDRLFGYDITSYGVTYDANSTQTGVDLINLRQHPTSGALYFDDLWRASQSVIVEAGLRGEGVTGTNWMGLSPRFSAKYFLTKDWAVTGAVGRFAQWTHSLAREDIPVRLFDFWVTSDQYTPVSTAWHYILGTERWFGNTRLARVEAFYKKYDNLLESNPQEDPTRRGDEYVTVQGDSYGLDVLLRQFESGPFSGWISYTYAVAQRRQGDFTYFPGHDRRHDFNIVGSWRLRKYVLGARFGYATGTPYTDIVSEIVRRIYDPGLNAYGTRGSGSQVEFVGGTRNGARLPTTQRLDLDVTRQYRVGNTSIAPYLSIVNAYDAKNVFFYIFDYAKSPPTREAISQFPILPSIGVKVAF